MAFEFDIKANVDISDLERKLNEAKSDIERARILETVKAGKGDISKTLRINAVGNDRGLNNTLKLAISSLDGLSKSARENVSQFKKLTNTQKGSALQIRNLVGYLKQQIASTRIGTKEYEGYERRLRNATRAQLEAQGISRGSVAFLQAEAATLRQVGQVRDLDSASREKLTSEILANEAAQRRAAGIDKGSIADKRALAARLQELSDRYTIGSAKQISFANAAQRVRASLNSQKSAFGGIVTALGKLATIQAGFVAVQTLIGQAAGSLNQFVGQQKAVEGFTLALQNVGLSAGEASEALKQASETANALGAPIQQVEKAYKRMVPALRAVGASTQETDKFIEGISARSQTLGLSTEESGRFMEAFAQVLSKGKLQAEELNQQISELDGAFRTQLADSLGVTTQELEKMISRSEVTADVFVKAFNNMQNGAEALRARVESGNFTIQQLQNLIRNLETENLRRIGAAIEPGIKAFLDIGRVFQEFIRDITQTQFGKFLADIFNGAVTGARAFIQTLLGVIKAVADLLSPVFALINGINAVLEPIGGLGGVLGFLVSSLVAAKVASIAFNAALDFNVKIAAFTKGLRLLNVGLLAFKKSLGEIKAGQFRSALQSFTKSLTSLSTGLVQATAKWLGFGDAAVKAFGRVGKAGKLGAAGSAAGAAAGFIGPALPPSYIKKYPEYSKAIMSVEASQLAATGSTAKLSAATIALGTTVAVAAAAGLIAYGVWNEGQKIQKALSGTTKELDDYLNDLGETVQKQPTFWGNVSKALRDAGNAIANFFGADASRVSAAIKSQKDYDASIGTAIIALKQLGVTLGDNASIQQLSDSQLRESIEISQLSLDAAKARVAALKELIKNEIAAGRGNSQATNELKENLTTAEQDVKVLGSQTEALKKNKEERIASGKATDALTVSVKELVDAQKLLQDSLETESIKKQTALLNAYGISSEDTAKLNIALKQEEIAFNEKLIASNEKLLASLKKRAENLQGEDREDARKEIAKLEKELAGQRKSLAEGNRDLVNEIINEFERVAQEGAKISDTYKSISSSIASAVDGVRGSASSVIGSLNQLIDSVAQREIQGLEVGSEKRKQIVSFQLRAQQRLNQIEDAIARAKLAAAFRVQQLEIQTSQQRLRAEAAIAAARGDSEAASALLASANAQDELLRLAEVQYSLDLKGLDLQRKYKNELIAQKAISEQIEPLSVGLKSQDLNSFQTLNKDLKDVESLTKGIGAGLDLSTIKAAEQSFARQKQATDELYNTLETTPQLLANSNEIAGYLADSMGGVATQAANARQEIVQLISALNSGSGAVGGPARWMGGSVSSGQTYTVNDGGFGREAFVNSFGRMTMLPPGQNIQWRAPTSGTIVPANIVKQMKNNRDINASLNVASTSTVPSATLKAMGANNIDSGNLIQRVASAMSSSGNTQRITNNVTIQSQEPVTDASKIMTNVARMKLRNSRRI